MQLARRISTWSGGKKPAYWGLCFTAEEAGSTVAMQSVDTTVATEFETSLNGVTWSPFTVDTTTITLAAAGDKVFFRAPPAGYSRLAASQTQYTKFVMAGRVAASGDITSLLNPTTPQSAFTAQYAFARLFEACTSLTAAPELPATTLLNGCYWRMFYGCTSLTAAPALPATTILPYSYGYMFYGCTSLSEIEVNLARWGLGPASANWVTDVSPSGTFRCPASLGTNETITRGVSRCPEGWTVVNI